MRILLMILLLVSVSFVSCWAETYSCRDSSGKLHFSDNLQGLPEECWGKERLVEPVEPDNLNYVPATPSPQGSGAEFKHSVRAVERELQQTETQKRQLQGRAEKLLVRYQQLVADKRQAKRSWDYASRGKIKQADAEIAQVRAEKQQLLTEMKTAKMTSKEKDAVRRVLQGIEAQ